MELTNSETTSIISPEFTPQKKFNHWLIVTLILFLILVGVLIYFFGVPKNQNNQKMVDNTSQKNTNTSSPFSKQIESALPPPANENIQGKDVTWFSEPQKVQSVGFFTLIDQFYPYKLEYCKSGTDCSKLSVLNDRYELKTIYYQVGTMKTQYAGSPVYLGITKGLPTTHVFKGIGAEKDIVYDAQIASLFIKTSDGKFVLTGDYQNGSIIGGVNNQNQPSSLNPEIGVTYNKDLYLDKAGSNYQYTFESDPNFKFNLNRTTNFFNKIGLFLVKDLGLGYSLYSNQDINSDILKIKSVISPNFIIKLPTGLVADVNGGSYDNGLVYQKSSANGYNPYSGGDQITWATQDTPKKLPKDPSDKGIMGDYTGVSYTSGYDGCRGSLTLENSSSDAETLDTKNDLVQVATTDKGDSIYEIKSKDFRIFQQFWFWKVTQNGLADVLTYNDYLALKPILIQKDQLGIYRMVFRSELVASKCWGEPLIYLYPEKQLDVQVGLSDVVGLTESEPKYNNGWSVTAYPDGKIYDKTSERYYPYLYWEGSAPVSSNPVIVSVVKREDIHNYFDITLSKLGLNSKEKIDFEKYWEPQINVSRYYLFSFYETMELNKIAPLNIEPKPDTLVRVLMSYQGLEQKVDVDMDYQDKDFNTPIRKGFTVVEWGGILHRENSR